MQREKHNVVSHAAVYLVERDRKQCAPRLRQRNLQFGPCVTRRAETSSTCGWFDNYLTTSGKEKPG